MRLICHPAALTSLTIAVLLQLSACGDTVETCEDSGNCASGGDGSGTGGDTTDTGGTAPGSGGGDGDGDTTDTETGGGTTSVGDGDGDQCVPALCPSGHCVGTECMECVYGDESKSCKSNSKPVCLEDDTCAQCAENSDCTDPEASVCNENNECVACTDDDGCSHLDITNQCLLDTNTCVECTIETETDKCGAKSCDPKTYECTETTRKSVEVCEACVADSECHDGHHCVPMEYKGEKRGGYCLELTGECEQPFVSNIDGRTSLFGVAGEAYCGINENLTTCEAVRAPFMGKPCNGSDSDCPTGGICRKVGGTAGTYCTYLCSNPLQCLSDEPYDTCDYGTPPATGGSSSGGASGAGGGSSTGGSTGTGGQKYCGG